MTSQLEFDKVMQDLLAATKSASEVTGVPPKFLLVAMLAALKREGEASPASPAEESSAQEAPGLMPTSARFDDFLKLIERDNPQLHRKLRGLD